MPVVFGHLKWFFISTDQRTWRII